MQASARSDPLPRRSTGRAGAASRALTSRRYLITATLIGLALAWIPSFLHGPIAAKFDLLYINGSIAVWGWYVARSLIGFFVGITQWPRPWFLRGPMVGFLVMLPLTLVSLATPGCGAPCMLWNLVTGTAIGALVAGGTRLLTGVGNGSSSDG